MRRAAGQSASTRPVPVAEKSKLGAKLAAGKFVAFVEILPPRGVDAPREIEGAKLCARARHRLHQRARRSARQRPHERASHLPVDSTAGGHRGGELHFCCRDRNILGIQSELLGAHAAGVRNLICITGDPPRMGAYPDATAVFDVDAIGLVNIVNNLNHGLDIGGNPMGSQTALFIGVGANPGALNMDEEIRRLEWKVEAGAEYMVTQPVFDLDLLEKFPEADRAHQNSSDLRHLAAHQLPQRRVHGERTARAGAGAFHGADAARGQRREGARGRRAIAREMVARVRGMVQGVQLSAPFGRYQMALDVAEAIGPRLKIAR